ncbi:MAG: hypothetical protein Q9171_007424, partial [Xanthocarpia ochracea]
SQGSVHCSGTGHEEASPRIDAIEDIFRLFTTDEVDHDAGPGPSSTGQQSANPDPSKSSYETMLKESSHQPTDPESTTKGGQKQPAAKNVLVTSQYRVRRPVSGSRRSQPSFLNLDDSLNCLRDH